jgi:hypothetical protein
MERAPGQVTFVSGEEDLRRILAHIRAPRDGDRAAPRGPCWPTAPRPPPRRTATPPHHLQRQPGPRPGRSARPAGPGRPRAPEDRGAQRGPAGVPHRQAGPRHPVIADEGHLRDRWANAATGAGFTPASGKDEWEQVIVAQDLARISARGDEDCRSFERAWRARWTDLARRAPDLTSIDLVLAEALVAATDRARFA